MTHLQCIARAQNCLTSMFVKGGQISEVGFGGAKFPVTPVFVSVDELLSFTYDEFYSRMLQEVPHIAKMVLPAESLRMILTEENRPEIDLSQKYFKSQITRLLNKGLRTIVIRVAANESPLPAAHVKPQIQLKNLKASVASTSILININIIKVKEA